MAANINRMDVPQSSLCSWCEVYVTLGNQLCCENAYLPLFVRSCGVVS